MTKIRMMAVAVLSAILNASAAHAERDDPAAPAVDGHGDRARYGAEPGQREGFAHEHARRRYLKTLAAQYAPASEDRPSDVLRERLRRLQARTARLHDRLQCVEAQDSTASCQPTDARHEHAGSAHPPIMRPQSEQPLRESPILEHPDIEQPRGLRPVLEH